MAETKRKSLTSRALGSVRNLLLKKAVSNLQESYIHYDVFLSHMQKEGGDQCHSLYQDLQACGGKVWFDMATQSELTGENMAKGVEQSRVYLLFVTNSVFSRPFVQLEAESAMKSGKTIIALLETENDTKDWETLKQEALPAWKPFFEKVQEPLIYYREGLNRVEMIRSILQTSVDESKLKAFQDKQVSLTSEHVPTDIVIFCHPRNGIDQSRVLQREMNVSVSVNPTEFEWMNSNTKVLFFITVDAFKQDLLLKGLDRTLKVQARMVFVQEMDSRRGGSQKKLEETFSDLSQGAPKQVRDSEWIQYHRRGDLNEGFWKTLMDRLQLAPNFLLTPTGAYSGKEIFSIPITKARLYEPGTREWLFPKIVESSSSQVAVVLGVGGMGKSVFMAEIARRYHRGLASTMGGGNPSPEMFIGALHFFRVNTIFSSAVRCLYSLALQLCSSVPGFSRGLNQANITSAGSNLKTLMKVLLIDPACQTTCKQSVKILIDALDECEEKDQFVNVLSNEWSKMPKWAVLVISSRPEEGIKEKLEKFKPNIIAPNKEENLQDLQVFFTNELRRLGVMKDFNEIRNELMRLSEGNFLWAQMQQSRMREMRNELSLDLIKKFPQGMNEMYKETFERIFVAFKEERKRYDLVLGLVLAAQEPLPLQVFASALDYDVEDERSMNDFVEEVQAPASNLLLFSPEDSTVRPPHKSMGDWLTGKDENSAIGMGCKNLSVIVDRVPHLKLGKACKTRIDHITKNKDLFSSKMVGSATPDDAYALKYVVRHLSQAGVEKNKDDILREFTDFSRLYSRIALIKGGVWNIVREGQILWDIPEVRLITQAISYANSDGTLVKRPRELGMQLKGRLQQDALEQGGVKIQQLLDQAENALGSYEAFKIIRSQLEAAGGNIRQILAGHTDKVTSIAISPDSKYICSGSWDMTCIIWDAVTGEKRHVLEGHTGEVTSVIFSPDSKYFCSGSGDFTCIVWDANSGERKHTLEGHTLEVSRVVFSPDSKYICSGSDDFTCIVWDANTGERKHTLEGHALGITRVLFSPDSKYICSGSWDKTCIVWDANTGEKKHILQGHSEFISSIAISPDFKYLCSGSFDKTCILWDIHTGEKKLILQGHSDLVSEVVFSLDSNYICSGSFDKTCIVWDSQTGATKHVLKGHTKEVSSVVFSPDSKYICSGSNDKSCIVWDAQTGERKHILQSHTHLVTSVVFSSDSKYICSGSKDGICIVWNASKAGERKHTLKGHSEGVISVVLCPDHKYICSGSYDKTCIVWNVQTGESKYILQGHKDFVSSVVFSPDSKYICSGSYDKTCIVWNAETGENIYILQGHTYAVNSVIFSPDSKYICSGSNDQTCIIWDSQKGETKHILQGHTKEVSSVIFSPDSKYIHSSSAKESKYWNVETGSEIFQDEQLYKTWNNNGHISECISVDERYIPPTLNAINFSNNEDLIGLTCEGACKVHTINDILFIEDNSKLIHILHRRYG